MRSLSIVSLICFCACLLASGQDHSQAKSSDNETTQIRANGNSAPQVRASAAHEATRDSSEQRKADQEPRPWLTHGEWVMSSLTLIYVALTAFYAWTSHKTLKALEDQSRDAKDEATARDKQFAEQLKVSRDAADAAVTTDTHNDVYCLYR